jgi:hypothetical protein
MEIEEHPCGTPIDVVACGVSGPCKCGTGSQINADVHSKREKKNAWHSNLHMKKEKFDISINMV